MIPEASKPEDLTDLIFDLPVATDLEDDAISFTLIGDADKSSFMKILRTEDLPSPGKVKIS